MEFTWDGRRLPGRLDEPVAVALWRAGIRVQTRSIKYHRARGPQCFEGGCPGCMVRIDGVPNQLGCQATVEDGMTVESQIGIPSAQRDLLAVVDRLFERFDHERDFVRPAPVRAAYEAVARRLAGFGHPPTEVPATQPGRELEAQVLIVGAGPAGLGAAHQATEAGGEVLLVDPGPPGGSLLHHPGTLDGGRMGRSPGPELARALSGSLPDERTRLLTGLVVGLYEDMQVAVLEQRQAGLAVHRVVPETLVLAAGAREPLLLVPGNDRPGVLTARAARTLLNRYGLPPGERILVADPGREGSAFVTEARARKLDVTVVDGLVEIQGSPEVTGARTEAGDVSGDTVVLDPGLEPAPELVQQAGLPVAYHRALGGRVPLHEPDGTTPLPGLLVAGGCAGIHDPEAALRQGQLAGAAALGAKPTIAPREILDRPGLTGPERAALEEVWGLP